MERCAMMNELDVNILYDGTWYGLLTAIFDTYEKRLQVKHIDPYNKASQQDVFTTPLEVTTDEQKAARVWKGIKAIVPADAARALYCAFLSEQPGIERCILSCVQFYLSGVKGGHHAYGNEDVLKVTQVGRSVDTERHRMKAFIRFQLTADGLYYAAISPDFNVLPLIAEHFEHRYADQRWLVYDLKRKYGISYDLEKVTEVTLTFEEGLADGADIRQVFGEGEELYQILWKDYFKHINIKERKNMKLHLQHVPRRYWKLLTEKV